MTDAWNPHNATQFGIDLIENLREAAEGSMIENHALYLEWLAGMFRGAHTVMQGTIDSFLRAAREFSQHAAATLRRLESMMMQARRAAMDLRPSVRERITLEEQYTDIKDALVSFIRDMSAVSDMVTNIFNHWANVDMPELYNEFIVIHHPRGA
jgi:ABC-type transporter Mla subunit MlaD